MFQVPTNPRSTHGFIRWCVFGDCIGADADGFFIAGPTAFDLQDEPVRAGR